MIKERVKSRRAQILEERKETMQRKRDKKEADEKKKSEQRIHLLLLVEKMGGLWKSEDEVKVGIDGLDEKEKMTKLYAQLQFHHLVLNSKADEGYFFQKSHTVNRRKIEFTSYDMMKHLISVINQNITIADPAILKFFLSAAEKQKDKSKEPVSRVLPEKMRIPEVQKQKEEFAKIVKEARIKRKTKKSKESLKELLEDPTLLIGKRIKHRNQESTEEDPEWYDASVLAIDKSTNEPMRTIYELCYDIDGQDSRFSFPLLNDLKKGDLIIL